MLVLGAGVAVLAVGCLLAFMDKGASVILPTYLFGFALILLGSPLGSKIANLSVSGTGLNVDFHTREVTNGRGATPAWPEVLRRRLAEIGEELDARLDQVRSDLNQLTSDVMDLASRGSGAEDILARLRRLEARGASDAQAEAPSLLSTSPVTLRVNDQLESYADVVAKLEASDYRYRQGDTFGSTSKPGGRPRQFVLSFGDGVPLAHIRRVTHMLEEFGLERIDYAGSGISGENLYTLYVGSYIYEIREVPSLDGPLMKLLDDPGTDIESFAQAVEASSGPINPLGIG